MISVDFHTLPFLPNIFSKSKAVALDFITSFKVKQYYYHLHKIHNQKKKYVNK